MVPAGGAPTVSHNAKRPAPHTGWLQLPEFVGRQGERAAAWQNGSICVLSSLDDMELPRQGGKTGPTWHVSISSFRPSGNVRPSDAEVRKALRAFRMVGAEEDNHSSGRARHFFMPVDPAARVACECKDDEEQVVEPDGYRYSRPKKA